MEDILAMLVLVVPTVLFMGAMIAKKLLFTCGPNEVLIFSGANSIVGGKRVGYKILKGGFRIRIPIIEVVDRIDLSNMTVEVVVRNAYSKGGIPLNVQSVAQLKVSGVQPYLGYAMQRFLGTPRDQVISVAQETLEGNLRGVLSTLTPEEVNSDKDAFATTLVEEAERDLLELGLELDTLKIQSVSDEGDYLDSLGRIKSAQLMERARISEADNSAQSATEAAQNRQRAKLAQIEAERGIVEANTETRISDALGRREALIAEEVGKVQALIAKAEGDLKVQQARLEQVRLKLEADVREPAEAEMKTLQLEAKAQAAKVIEDGRATAAVLEQLVLAWQAGGEQARDIFLMQKLNLVMGALLDSIQQLDVDRLTVLPGQAGTASQSARLVEEIKAGTGVDLTQVVQSFTSKS